MITAGVQHASQMAEIQGAPPSTLSPAPALGEEFRVAFAAKVEDNAASGKARIADALVAEKPVGDGKASSGLSSAKQAQSGLPVARIATVAVDRGQPEKSSAIALGTGKIVADPNPIAAVLTEKAPAFVSAQRDSGDIEANLPATSERANDQVENAPSSIAANDDFAGSHAVASVPVVNTVKVKERPQVAETAGSRIRKNDVAVSNKNAVADAARQSSLLTENLSPPLLTATPTATTPILVPVSLTPVAVLPLASHNAELSAPSLASNGDRETSGQRVAELNEKVAGVKTSASTGPATGIKRIADAHSDGVFRDTNALPIFGTVDVIPLAARPLRTREVVTSQLPAMPTERRSAGSVDAVQKGPATAADQSVPAVAAAAEPYAFSENFAALFSRSGGVSERVPVSTAMPGAPSLGELDKTVRQQQTVELKDISRTEQLNSSNEIKTGQSEARTLVKPHSMPGEVSTGARLSSETKSSSGGDSFGTLPEAASATNVPSQVDAKATLPQTLTLAPAPIVEQPPQARTGLSQAVTATGNEGKSKRAASADDTAVLAPQSAPNKATATPTVAAVTLKDAVGSAAPVANGGIAVPATHTAAGTVAAPVHAVSPIVTAGSNPASVHAVGRLEAGFAAEPASAAQSGELHRTLLATPTALEVGVQSGTQGWLKIRAEVGGQGEVKAWLDAVSASGRNLLHSQLPALNAFLHNEQVPVTASVVERGATPNGGVGGMAMGSSGLGGANGSGVSDGSLLQSGGGQREAERHFNSTGSEPIASYDTLGGVSDSAAVLSGLQVGTSTESGRWLSVRV